MKTRVRLATAVCLLALSAVGTSPAAAANETAAAACNRACLTDLLTQSIDGLATGDHSSLTLTAPARITENSQDMKLGEGIWRSVTGAGGFRQDYIDTTKQIAATQVEMREGKNPVLLSIVLHTEGG